MKKVLRKPFFERSSIIVAEELLGKYLVRRCRGKETALLITETEAYDGPHDKACHASKGRTPRTDVMFGPAGVWYVYFVYGVHWMLNIVTDVREYPSAVLIRGLHGITGPARVTKAFTITKAQNEKPAARDTGLWIEDRGVIVPKAKVERTKRIGVEYAGPLWAEKPYRFILKP